MNEVVIAQFDECHSCHKSDWLMERMLKLEEKKGRSIKGITGCLQLLGAAAMGPTSKMLFGQKVSQGTAVMDVCCNCGALTARQIIQSEMEIEMPDISKMGMPRTNRG